MLLAGLDIGTTGCKISVYRPDGDYLGRIYRDYPLTRTESEHEVDPALVWKGVQDVLTEAAVKWPDIGGIGITSFGESFVLLDANDRPLHNSMLYTDPRGEEECRQLCEALGSDNIAYITGLNPHPMFSISKLMWIKANRPDIYVRAKRILFMEDYVVYLLTGVAQIDYALATRTMAFDIRRLAWSDEILLAAGISKDLLSKPVPAGSEAGHLKPDAVKKLGFQKDILIVSAGHDQVAAAAGSGVFDESVAVDGAGTVECITPVFTGIPNNDYMTKGNYSIVPHVIPGKYVCYAFLFTGGAAVNWFTENLAGYAAGDAFKKGTDIYEQLGSNIPLDKPTGLLVLPHFAGAATPYMDTGSKAAIVGLTLATTQHDIFCAIMEGVCYEMRLNTERLKEAGVGFNGLRATGGGANSRAWMQMKADILNVPVTALRSTEAGGLGAAMMVGINAGLFTDFYEAAEKMVFETETFFPRPDVCKIYNGLYSKYRQLYAAVRPLV